MVMTLMFRIVLYAPILGIGGVLKVLQTESTMTWVLGPVSYTHLDVYKRQE